MTTSRNLKYPQRVRNELRFRELTVLRVERIGSAFQRIVLGGEALEGFVSQGFDEPAAGRWRRNRAISWSSAARAVRWWCRKITPGNCM